VYAARITRYVSVSQAVHITAACVVVESRPRIARVLSLHRDYSVPEPLRHSLSLAARQLSPAPARAAASAAAEFAAVQADRTITAHDTAA